jgi:hypothetical protein
LRRLEDAENDLQELEAKRWRQKANNREEWSTVVNDTKFFFFEDRRAKEYVSRL